METASQCLTYVHCTLCSGDAGSATHRRDKAICKLRVLTPSNKFLQLEVRKNIL